MRNKKKLYTFKKNLTDRNRKQFMMAFSNTMLKVRHNYLTHYSDCEGNTTLFEYNSPRKAINALKDFTTTGMLGHTRKLYGVIVQNELGKYHISFGTHKKDCETIATFKLKGSKIEGSVKHYKVTIKMDGREGRPEDFFADKDVPKVDIPVVAASRGKIGDLILNESMGQKVLASKHKNELINHIAYIIISMMEGVSPEGLQDAKVHLGV